MYDVELFEGNILVRTHVIMTWYVTFTK